VNSFRPELTPEHFNGRSAGHLPGLVGLQILAMTPQGVQSRLEVRKALMAPNGFLHAATVIALADTSCGYGCVAHLPQGATGFTTLELKANFLGTTRDGAIACRAWPVRLGKVDRPGALVLQSSPMHRRYFGFFFHFPRPLAEGNG
jgi:uncharacterized protein (TIGR00369 family)